MASGSFTPLPRAVERVPQTLLSRSKETVGRWSWRDVLFGVLSLSVVTALVVFIVLYVDKGDCDASVLAPVRRIAAKSTSLASAPDARDMQRSHGGQGDVHYNTHDATQYHVRFVSLELCGLSSGDSGNFSFSRYANPLVKDCTTLCTTGPTYKDVDLSVEPTPLCEMNSSVLEAFPDRTYLRSTIRRRVRIEACCSSETGDRYCTNTTEQKLSENHLPFAGHADNGDAKATPLDIRLLDKDLTGCSNEECTSTVPVATATVRDDGVTLNTGGMTTPPGIVEMSSPEGEDEQLVSIVFGGDKPLPTTGDLVIGWNTVDAVVFYEKKEGSSNGCGPGSFIEPYFPRMTINP